VYSTMSRVTAFEAGQRARPGGEAGESRRGGAALGDGGPLIGHHRGLRVDDGED